MRVGSSHSQMFFKIGALINFAIFTEKHTCWSFSLIKLHAWRPATLLKWLLLKALQRGVLSIRPITCDGSFWEKMELFVETVLSDIAKHFFVELGLGREGVMSLCLPNPLFFTFILCEIYKKMKNELYKYEAQISLINICVY